MSDRMRKYLTILVLGISGGTIYLIPYIRYVFYDFQIQAMQISNQQIGMLSSLYAVGCMLTYIPGGLIADRTSANRNIFLSLITTTIVTIIFAFNITKYNLALVLWFMMALTTSFVFWTSLMKTIRMVSDEDEQGRMYGLYYATNGITGGLVNAIALNLSGTGNNVHDKFFIAVIAYAVATAIAAILVVLVLKEKKEVAETVESSEENEFKFSQVGTLLKNPTIWIFALVIFSGYAVYSSTSYFTPYLTDVVGVSPEDSGLFTIIRTYFMMLVAPIGGILADKVFKSTSKWFMIAFFILAILFVSVLFIPTGINPTLVSLYTLLPGAVGLALYGVIFSIQDEANIPPRFSATAVGIASIIGYTPDFFMATMFGSWLDNYGTAGYTGIFIFLAAVSLVGLGGAFYIRKKSKSRKLLNE